MRTPFDLPLLLRPLAWGLVLLLVHWTQLSIAVPPLNAAVLAPGPGVHAEFVQATAEPFALRADRTAGQPKSPPSAIPLQALAAAAGSTGTVLLPLPRQCAPTALPLKGFDACGPPLLA